jgi:hypothetical protein
MVMLPAAAFAHRPATRSEKIAILAAVVHQHALNAAQAACQVVTVSTVNYSFAKVTWPARLSRLCRRVAANGVIIEHKNSKGWQFVTVGSSLTCPIKGVPAAVARDLAVCS